MNNAYYRRSACRLQRNRERQRIEAFIKLSEIDAIQKHYEDAWFALYGSKTVVRYRKGWYWIHNHAVRQTDLLVQTAILEARLLERDTALVED